MINLLVAAAVSLALPAGSPTVNASPASEAVSPDMTNANPAPAMFVVGDGDTTVYIFGTFHALDGQSDWFNQQPPRCLRALRRADAGNHASRRPAAGPGTPYLRCSSVSRRQLPCLRRPRWRSTPARRGACRWTMAPTWCSAISPRRKASRSTVWKRSIAAGDVHAHSRLPPVSPSPRARPPATSGT